MLASYCVLSKHYKYCSAAFDILILVCLLSKVIPCSTVVITISACMHAHALNVFTIKFQKGK